MTNRWAILAGAVPIQLCLGAVYAWSVFRMPLQAQFGWSSTAATIPFQVILLCFAFTMVLGGLWQDRVGPRVVASVGGLALALGLLLASLARSVATLSLSYGVIGGLGLGLAYGCPIAAGLKWFPDKRGLITGLVVASFGAGALLFAPVARALIDAVGVSKTFAILGCIFAAGVVGGAQLLRNPPPGYSPPGWQSRAKATAAWNAEWPEMVKTPQFYLLVFLYCIGCAAGFVVIAHAAPMAQSEVTVLKKLIVDGHAAEAKTLAALAVGILAIFNAAGRVGWGMLSDAMGRSRTLAAVFLGCAGGLLALPHMSDFAGFVTAISIVGACFGGFLAIFPAITAEFYGTKHIGVNYGTVFIAYGIGGFIGSLASARAFDLTGQYQTALVGAAACCGLCAVLAVLLRAPQAKPAATSRA
jgi:OFA family oxalate/formate antiporter-like MFS transporter